MISIQNYPPQQPQPQGPGQWPQQQPQYQQPQYQQPYQQQQYQQQQPYQQQPPMMQPPGAPKKNNTMMIAIIIAVVAIVVIAVVALVVLNGGSSAANLHVLTIDKSKVTLFDWGLNGGHVTVDVTVQNTGLSAASGTLKVEIQIGSYKYSGTSSIPTTQSGDERTISVDVTIPALQAGMMGTFYEPIVTATVQ